VGIWRETPSLRFRLGRPLERVAERLALRAKARDYADLLEPGERLLACDIARLATKQIWIASSVAIYVQEWQRSHLVRVPWHAVWQYEERGEQNYLVRIVRYRYGDERQFELVGQFSIYRYLFTQAVRDNLDPSICFTE
jgi:hypothetical protein